MLHKGFVLVYSTDYAEPDVYGIFDTYQDALDRYRIDLMKSGADIEDDEDTEALYFEDDGVMIGRFYNG